MEMDGMVDEAMVAEDVTVEVGGVVVEDGAMEGVEAVAVDIISEVADAEVFRPSRRDKSARIHRFSLWTVRSLHVVCILHEFLL